jgi:hypothetical protein
MVEDGFRFYPTATMVMGDGTTLPRSSGAVDWVNGRVPPDHAKRSAFIVSTSQLTCRLGVWPSHLVVSPFSGR